MQIIILLLITCFSSILITYKISNNNFIYYLIVLLLLGNYILLSYIEYIDMFIFNKHKDINSISLEPISKKIDENIVSTICFLIKILVKISIILL